MDGVTVVCLCALSAVAIAFIAAYISLRVRARRLAARLEAFLAREEAAMPYSVREDSLAPLTNAIAELQNRALLSEERERAERRRASALTADISHQLKTPLSSLRLFCEMDEGQHIGDQLAQIERMERLIYALLRFYRLSADGYEFAFAEREAADIAKSAWENVRPAFSARDFAIEGEASVRCDERWLGEAFSNILKNACEHTPPGGRIRVSLEATNRAFLAAFEDDGGGVPARELPRLFERFHRAPGSPEGGAGIGLAIAREIVIRHHGDIYAENGEKGLRVRISIPRLSKT